MRASAFVDGFKFYHAVDDARLDRLKWVDLRAVCRAFVPAPRYDLAAVLYFSAFATWRPAAYARHRAYVAALRAVGGTPVMGKFKAKQRQCRHCGAQWTSHEEKETDVSIAVALIEWAVKDLYDRALLVSCDSDLAPAVRFVRREFPEKEVRIVAPLGRQPSLELVHAAGCRRASLIQITHLERALLPATVIDHSGRIVAQRPEKYDPPAPGQWFLMQD